MYIDEKYDQCDLCRTVVSAGNAAYSEHGEYKDKDVCVDCMAKLHVTNCGGCGSVYPIESLSEDYFCPVCCLK